MIDGRSLPLLPQPPPLLWGISSCPCRCEGLGPASPCSAASWQALPALQDLDSDLLFPSIASTAPPPLATSRIRREKRGPLLSPAPVGLGQV